MFNLRKLAIACAISALTATGPLAQTTAPSSPPADAATPSVGQAGKDVIWLPTAQGLVDRMLEIAKVTPDDYVIDLGSGDGRTVITAARLGARARGIEYDAGLVALSQRNAEAAGVSERATFVQGDIFESDFSEATVITLFLLPSLNVKLRPLLLDMEPGTRVVSNSFDMGDWEPDESVEASSDCVNYCTAHLWIIPAKVQGNWRLGDGELSLTQTYQMLSGALTQNGQATPITDARMDGRSIVFTAGGSRYSGQVNDDGNISGTIEGGGEWSASRVGE
ncbi:SAM-dependent methyltransferase [Pseudochelatococcus sp. B33]